MARSTLGAKNNSANRDSITADDTSLSDKPGQGLLALHNLERVQKRLELSNQERCVATLLCQGKTRAAIAEHLGLKLSTVRSYIDRVFDKLGVDSTAEMVFRFAIELLKLNEPDD